MIQLNLLPDIKAKYIATEHTKRLTLLSATGVCAVAIGIVLSLIGVAYGTQKARLNSLDKNITAYNSKLQGIEGLNKILTIQNQLNSLTTLHDQKPATSRLFEYLPQITPIDVKINSLTIKYEDNSMAVSGTATSLEMVNKFVDTIKFTEYSTDQSETKLKAFSSVVLASFGKSALGVSYSMTAFFDPAIFSGNYNDVILSVPSITSTRSQTEQPDLLFQAGSVQNQEPATTNPESELQQ